MIWFLKSHFFSLFRVLLTFSTSKRNTLKQEANLDHISLITLKLRTTKYHSGDIFIFALLPFNASKKREEIKFAIKSDSFSSLHFLIEMLLVRDLFDVYPLRQLAKKKKHWSGLRTITFLLNQFRKIVKSWFNEVIMLLIFLSH